MIHATVAFLSGGGQAPDVEVFPCGTGADHICANGLYPSELYVSFSPGKVKILTWAILGHDTLAHSLGITNFIEKPVAPTFILCVLLGMTPSSLVGDYQRFGETCFHIQGLLGCEDGGNRFLRNAGYSLSDYNHDRRPLCNVSPP